MAEVNTVEVDTLALASAVSGYLLTPSIGAVYGVIEQLTGVAPYTHQLPRMGRELEQHVKAALPGFPLSAEAEAANVGPDNFAAYAYDLIQTWGERISLAPMVADAKDPVAELVEMVGPERVVVATTPEAPQ